MRVQKRVYSAMERNRGMNEITYCNELEYFGIEGLEYKAIW